MGRPLFIACNGAVAAIDTDTGREVWRQRLQGSLTATLAGADVNICEHDLKVFAGIQGHVFALSGFDGRVLWSNALPGFGYNDVTLIVAAGRLIAACNGAVAALDPNTGKELWRGAMSAGVLNATAGYDVTLFEWNGRIFVGCNGKLRCVRPEDGADVWVSDLPGMGYNDVSLTIEGRGMQILTKVERRS